MATYKSKKELEGKTLEHSDVVVLTIRNTDYIMTVARNSELGCYLYHSILSENIFRKLELNIKEFVRKTVGYLLLGDFPEHYTLEDLTKTTLALFSECEKFNKPKGVVDLSVIPEWKIGDIVWFRGWLVIEETDYEDEYPMICGNESTFKHTFTVEGLEYKTDTARALLTTNEALLCFGLTPSDEILELSAQIVRENMPEIEEPEEEEMVSVQLTKSQYDKLLTLLNE